MSNHNFAFYPPDLKKKVVLIQHFKGYLDGAKFEPNLEVPYPEPVENRDWEGKLYSEIFLKKWKRAKKAILFRLSNKVIQVCYQDSSEVILASGTGTVTFITSWKEIRTTPLYSDLEKQDPSLFKRLNYAKEILLNMINPSKEDEETKNGNKENPEKTRPSTTKYSSSNGDSGATSNIMRSLESDQPKIGIVRNLEADTH